MSDPTVAMPIDEISRLRARVQELEAQLRQERMRGTQTGSSRTDRVSSSDSQPRTTDRTTDDDSNRVSRRRVADSLSDARSSKRDVIDRMMRGGTLASAEFVRAFAETVSSFADTVISRNDNRRGDDRTARDMVTRLPEDIATSFADAVDRFIDVPSRAADRYAKTYRESDRMDSGRHRDRDRRD